MGQFKGVHLAIRDLSRKYNCELKSHREFTDPSPNKVFCCSGRMLFAYLVGNDGRLSDSQVRYFDGMVDSRVWRVVAYGGGVVSNGGICIWRPRDVWEGEVERVLREFGDVDF